MPVYSSSSEIVVSKGNSSYAPLIANAAFVGVGEEVSSFSEIDINLFGTPNNASGSLYFEFSPDGINWDVSVLISGGMLPGPNIVPQYLRIILPYFRVRYINGSTIQTAFRLTIVYHRNSAMRLTRFLDQNVDNTEGVQVSRSIISGERPDGTYDNVPLDKDNFLSTIISNVGPKAQNRLVAADKAIFGSGVVESRKSQVSADFTKTFEFNNIDITATNTGYANQINGLATFATGNDINGSIKAQTGQVIRYNPGREIYLQFTAVFTTPININSKQQIGLYNTGNGYFIGYHGTTFGITIRNGGVDTFIPRTSFNTDTLTGNSLSLFLRNGVPEAMNTTLLNVFRIRFGWLGSASIIFETMAPDGDWVMFHSVKQPNTSALPSIQNPSLPITVEVIKTGGDATDLKIFTASWDAGVVSSQSNDVFNTGVISSLNDTATTTAAGLGDIGVQISGTWTGTIVFEATIDGSTWNSVSAAPIGAGSIETPSTTTNGAWRLTVSGLELVRLRSSAWSSGSATITIQGSPSSSVVRAIQGAPSQVTNAWPMKITDGTSVVSISGANALLVDGSATIQPTKLFSSSGTTSTISCSTSTITLLGTNSNRLGATVFNSSNTNVYVKLGPGATNSNYTVKMNKSAYYEVPYGYTGVITGTCDVAIGSFLVTEIT